jgi:hypothetical protein
MKAYLLIALMTMAAMAVFRVASYMALGPQGSWILILLVSLAITYFFTMIIERA